MPDEKLIASAAYGLFVDETVKHLQSAMQSLKGAPAMSADECRKLGAAFHTVRGGAGFFGLSAISTLSHQLEDLLLTEGACAHLDIDKVKKLVQELSGLVSKLPPPKNT